MLRFEPLEPRWLLTDLFTTSVGLDVAGNLTVADVSAAGHTDALSISWSNNRVFVADPTNTLGAGPGATQVDTHTVSVPAAAITGRLQVNTQAGDDTLTLDLRSGNPIPVNGLSFRGGPGTNSLALQGSGVEIAFYQPSDHAGTDGLQGRLVVDSRPVDYDGLIPLDVVNVASLTVQPAGLGDQLTLANGMNLTNGTVPVGTESTLVVSGTTGGATMPAIAVWDSGALAIDTASNLAQDGSDTLTIIGADGTAATGANIPELTIRTGDSGADSVSLTGSVNVADRLSVTTHGSLSLTGNGEIRSDSGSVFLDATGTSGDLTVNGGTGIATHGGDIQLLADRTVTISKNVSNTGTGRITVTGNPSYANPGARNILVDSGAAVTVVNGSLTLDADQGTALTGKFVGIDLNNALLTSTGTGAISLYGRGGGGDVSNDPTAIEQIGIRVQRAAVVASTSTAPGAGTITLVGTGGAGQYRNFGVDLEGLYGRTTGVSSATGAIQISGQGGGQATGTYNHGVLVMRQAQVNSTKNAKITIVGTGGAGPFLNVGVDIESTYTKIAATDGDIEITGTGGQRQRHAE